VAPRKNFGPRAEITASAAVCRLAVTNARKHRRHRSNDDGSERGRGRERRVKGGGGKMKDGAYAR